MQVIKIVNFIITNFYFDVNNTFLVIINIYYVKIHNYLVLVL